MKEYYTSKHDIAQQDNIKNPFLQVYERRKPQDLVQIYKFWNKIKFYISVSALAEKNNIIAQHSTTHRRILNNMTLHMMLMQIQKRKKWNFNFDVPTISRISIGMNTTEHQSTIQHFNGGLFYRRYNRQDVIRKQSK